MKKNKGLYSLIVDCDSYKKKTINQDSSKKKPVNQRSAKKKHDFIEDVQIVDTKSVEDDFYDTEASISLNISGEEDQYSEESSMEEFEYEQAYVEVDEDDYFEREVAESKEYESTEDDFTRGLEEGEVYVEPFEDTKISYPPATEKPDYLDSSPIDIKAPNIIPETKKGKEQIVKPNDPDFQPEKKPVYQDSKPQEKNRNYDEKLKKVIRQKDKEFEDDLMTILKNQKKAYAGGMEETPPENSGRRTVRKARTNESQEDSDASNTVNRMMKDEHQIFDRIAQSMKMANAYDLGSIDIERRFDSFDEEIDDHEEGTEEVSKKKR